ncbi:alpha/beta fold hydrolase [Actinomadura logoneensis]|uniref:Alpha/beta fold hydrolase n=1 Tax=Actinomadura logoneensis TaxID=2293572 RepID=A0A372JPF0_9ACTN|nr:alpha/beta fold hydrolase [Actinomadura logoneensis]RFU41840.1 alpha/beta fold hydrolase [Actinomadura logoneensis]
MDDDPRRGRAVAGRAVAALPALDGVLHLYWTTGLTWPAPDDRSLSLAVLGGEVPFTPRVLLPLAALLLGTSAAVAVFARGSSGRRTHRLCGLVAFGLAVGLLVRGLAGVVWACGVLDGSGSTFYWLNLLLYTPVCLAFGTAAAWLVGVHRHLGRAVALALPLVLVAAAMVGAYGWRPGEQRGYRSPFLASVPSRYLDTPVARFHYVRQGTGGSPVVLLSPGAAWVFAWRAQLTALSRTHTVYVLDLPGQGYTTVRDPHFTWDLEGMTAAVDSFLTGLRLPSVALAGNSWSGGWALAYAQRHPDRVGRLVLLAPSGLHERDPMAWEAMKMPAVGELLTNLAAGRGTVASSVRGLFVHKERATGAVIDAMWAPGTRGANLRSNYRLERGLDWRGTERALPSTRQPALVVWGRQDTVLPVRQARRFGALLPHADVRVLEGCGHALTLDCPDEVSGLMETFLR